MEDNKDLVGGLGHQFCVSAVLIKPFFRPQRGGIYRRVLQDRGGLI